MQSQLNPYLNFNGNAKEALLFYNTVLNGELTMNTFKEGGMPHDPAEADKIMHGMITTNKGIVLMASDSPKDWPYSVGTHMSISLSGEDEAELRGYWDRLGESAKIDAPLAKAPWGDHFGMLTDKFGIRWMVNITAPKV